MLYKVNMAETISPKRGMHYQFHQRIETRQYPQVHDFYEISLITEGAMEVEINGRKDILLSGSILLIRPGDIHSRKAAGTCSYMNLAFPGQVLTEMFRYLDMPKLQQRLQDLSCPLKTEVSSGEALILKARMEKLNLLPAEQTQAVCMELRRLILEIMMQYFFPVFMMPPQLTCPVWLERLVEKMENPEVLSLTLDNLVVLCGCTKEHLCRSFRRYLGVSPTAYLNAKRLNYAANLLAHSDQKVIDIAYASGFQSLSRFYHAFKKEFRMAPMEYRCRHASIPVCAR